MPTCKYLGCDMRSDTVFCTDHTMAKQSDGTAPRIAKHSAGTETLSIEVAKHAEEPRISAYAESGRRGGLKTSSQMTKEQKVARAKKAAAARWGRIPEKSI